MAKANDSTPQERARKRVKNFTGLMWHLVTYVIVNVFLWVMTPGAVIWVAVPWGVGLAFHAASYFLDERGFQSRRYDRILAEEQKREDR